MVASKNQERKGSVGQKAQGTRQIDPRKARIQWIVALAAILAVFGVLVCFLPLGSAVKIGADEDFELSKATLLNHGYHLYTEIWNDQPPLDTVLVAAILKHLSPSVAGPRLLTVFFSGVLMASLFALGRRTLGTLVAVLAGVFLLASPGYLELSMSCMQELPALAPAVAALAILAWGRGRSFRWTDMMAGLVFGVAMQMKLIGLMYLPLVPLIFWVRGLEGRGMVAVKKSAAGVGSATVSGVGDASVVSRRFSMGTFLAALAAFGVAALGSFVALNYGTGHSLMLQLKQGWEAHISGAQSFEYGAPADHPYDWSILFKNWDATIPALIGVVVLLKQSMRKPFFLVPVAWLLLTYIVLPSHVPWWSYYYVHNAVPLCWCAAVGVATVVEALRSSKRAAQVAVGVVGLGFAGWMGGRVYIQVYSIRNSPQLHSALILKEIARYKPFTEFFFADEPIYTFHSDIPMPPRLAVISLKRLWSGDMTPAKLRAEMEKIKPGLVLLGNDTAELPFQELMDTEYWMCYQDTKYRLFVLRAIARKPDQ